MTAGPTGSPDDPEPGPRPDGLRPLPGGALALAVLTGLVGGRLLRPLAIRLGETAPLVTWLQGLALVFVAAILGAVAWQTWRALHVRRERIEPHQAVNRLVLARACALVGALAAGGYGGYAVSWWGDASERAGSQVATSLVAAAGGVAVVITSRLLERACRVRSDDDRA